MQCEFLQIEVTRWSCQRWSAIEIPTFVLLLWRPLQVNFDGPTVRIMQVGQRCGSGKRGFAHRGRRLSAATRSRWLVLSMARGISDLSGCPF